MFTDLLIIFESNRCRYCAIAFLISLAIVQPVVCEGQVQDTSIAPQTRQEVWPEINFFYRFNEKFRLFAFASATQLKSSSYTDGGLALNLDYFAFPVWRHAKARADSARGNLLWLRGGLAYSKSPGDAEDPFQEYTIVTEANARFYLPWKMLLTNKNRFDWRFVNGDFKPRYRPRLTVERDFKTDFLTFTAYSYAEYFINFNSGNSDRLRVALGCELRVSKHINFETYLVHQFDNDFQIPSVNAAGFVLKFFFHKGEPWFKKLAKKPKMESHQE